MSEISKEELNAFTEAHIKSSVALEKIAERLESILNSQEVIVAKMTNGMPDTIIKGVVDNYNNTHKETVKSLERIEAKLSQTPVDVIEKVSNSSIAKDIEHVKWFVGIVGVVVIVAIVILRGLEMSDTMKKFESIHQQAISQSK
jgi:hypothetical protein